MDSLDKFNHVDLLFPSKYLKAADLRSKKLVVVIEKIDPRGELQMQGGRKERKPIVYLVDQEKTWVLNKTNAKTIAKLYGNEVTEWIGKPISLRSEKVAFGNQIVDAIRVVDEVPKTNGKSNGKLHPVGEDDEALAEFMGLLEELPAEVLKQVKLDKFLGDKEKILALGAERIAKGIEFLRDLNK